MEGKDVWHKEKALQGVVEFNKSIDKVERILSCFIFLCRVIAFGRARWTMGLGEGMEVTVVHAAEVR